jgi:hypothetical protein
MNWYIIFPFGIVLFLIKRNQKDEKKYETFLNNDFPKKIEEDEIENS